jgi:hypothetical protein
VDWLALRENNAAAAPVACVTDRERTQ